MRNLFLALLIFIFVMCLFFIPHGEAIQPEAGFPMGICQGMSPQIGDDSCIVPMAQMPLVNSTLEKNLCETTYVSIRPTMKHIIMYEALDLTNGITVYKVTGPRSFHAGK